MGLLLLLAHNGVWAITVAFFLAGVSAAAFLIQRIYFHPLSKYPGPFLAKVTDLYAAYHAWKGDIHIDMWRCHQIYGEYVRYAPERLNINSAAALQDIYGNNKNFTKSPNYRVLRHGPANTLTMIDKKEHARRRRIMAQGVSDASMRTHEFTILAHIRKCFDKVSSMDDEGLGLVETMCDYEDGWTTARNMSSWFNWLTFDIMGDLIFGVQYNLLGQEKNRVIPEAIEDSNVRVSTLLQSPIIRQIGRIDRWLFPKAIGARNVFLKFVSDLVDTCMTPKDGQSARTVLSILKTATDPETGGKLSTKELLAESTTLCVAGADTTSTALAATFFYLSRNSRAYEKAVEEVRSTFESTEEIRLGAKLGSLRYLRACVDEAMRMSPPVGSSLSRRVLPGGAKVNGELFVEGVELGVPIYAIQHNPKYFPDPFAYRPERWIVGENGTIKANVEFAQSALCPFSIGPRSCVGKGMAIVELMLTMSFALFTSDFRIAEGYSDNFESLLEKRLYHPDEFTTKDHITATKSGPYLQFRQRETVRTVDTLAVPRVEGREREHSAPPLHRELHPESDDDAPMSPRVNHQLKLPKLFTRQPNLKSMALDEIYSPVKQTESFSPQKSQVIRPVKPKPVDRYDTISPLTLHDTFKPKLLKRQGTNSPMSPTVSKNGNDIFISVTMNK